MHVSQGKFYTHTPTHHARSNGSFADHEPGLWRAVITQALMDAANQSRKSEAERIRSDALSWLLSNTDDFTAVCDNAGLDPDYVRSRARTALARNCQWRLPVGMGWRTRARAYAAQRATETIAE